MLSTREVANLTGIGRQSVHDWVKDAGISRTRNASREYGRSVQERAVDLYNQGLSSRQVAEAVGASRTSVSRWIHSAGVMRSGSVATSMGNPQYSWEIVAQVGSMRSAGSTYREIFEATGVPIGSIRMVVLRYEKARKLEKRKVRMPK